MKDIFLSFGMEGRRPGDHFLADVTGDLFRFLFSHGLAPFAF